MQIEHVSLWFIVCKTRFESEKTTTGFSPNNHFNCWHLLGVFQKLDSKRFQSSQFSDQMVYGLIQLLWANSVLCRSKCEDICYNTAGSYECRCRSGFVLNADGRSCDGKDSVLLRPKKGKKQQQLAHLWPFSCFVSSWMWESLSLIR